VSETWAQTQVLRLSSLVSLLALALIIVAGLDLGANGVRAFTASSMPGTSIGAAHLAVALLTAVATLILVAVAWLRVRDNAQVLRASVLALVLITVQLTSMSAGGSSVSAAWAASVHFGATALLMATALVLVTFDRSVVQWVASQTGLTGGARGSVPHLVHTAAATLFAVLVSGAYLGASGPSDACSGWPLCGPTSGTVSLLDPQNVHRILVGGAAILLLILAVMLVRLGTRLIVPVALLMIFVAEAVIGAVSAGGSESALVSGTHFGTAGVAWMFLVVVGLVIRPGTALEA
jgi:heme A synthase